MPVPIRFIICMPVQLLTIVLSFPPEGQALERMVNGFVDGENIKQPAVNHGVDHVFCILYSLKRVAVNL